MTTDNEVSSLTRLQQLKDLYHKHFIIHDDSYIDVVFGVIFAYRLSVEPVWIYLIGPPSSGKNELLEAIASDKEQIFIVDTLTPRTLVSGAKKQNGRDPSLLPYMLGKTTIVKDFTTLLSGRHDSLVTIMGQLRLIYDGQFDPKYGTGDEQKSYTGKVGFIIGVTEAIDKHRDILSPLGERLLSYRMPSVTDAEEFERCQRAQEHVDRNAMKAELAEAARFVLENPVTDCPILRKSFKEEITRLGMFIAKGRHTSMEDPFTHEPELVSHEVATRVTKQLNSLVCGIAMAREHELVTRSDMASLRDVALHCLTTKREKLLRFLASCWPAYAETKKIAEHMRVHESVARRWLWELYRVRLVLMQEGEKAADMKYPTLRWKVVKSIAETLNEL